MVFSPDGTLIAATTWRSDVKVWQLVFHHRSGEFLRCEKLPGLVGHSKGVCSAAFNSDATRAVSASLDGTLKLWSTPGR